MAPREAYPAQRTRGGPRLAGGVITAGHCALRHLPCWVRAGRMAERIRAFATVAIGLALVTLLSPSLDFRTERSLLEATNISVLPPRVAVLPARVEHAAPAAASKSPVMPSSTKPATSNGTKSGRLQAWHARADVLAARQNQSALLSPAFPPQLLAKLKAQQAVPAQQRALAVSGTPTKGAGKQPTTQQSTPGAQSKTATGKQLAQQHTPVAPANTGKEPATAGTQPKAAAGTQPKKQPTLESATPEILPKAVVGKQPGHLAAATTVPGRAHGVSGTG